MQRMVIQENLRIQQIMQPLHEILQPQNQLGFSLFLGDIISLEDKYIKKYKIKSVLSILQKESFNQNILNQNQFKYQQKIIFADDDPYFDFLKFFDECVEYIKNQRRVGNILVHCIAGVSRSATIVIAFLIKESKQSYSFAYNFVKSIREVINPNEGFILQLKQYEKICRNPINKSSSVKGNKKIFLKK